MSECPGTIRFAAMAVYLIAFSPFHTVAQDGAVLPPGDETPILRVAAEGPIGYLSGLAFTPDESTLYAASWDKQVHSWKRVPADGSYRYHTAGCLRVPIGGALDGALNAVAISDDGRYLAAAGRGLSRNNMGVRREGWVAPQATLTEEDHLDRGLIYVFHLQEKQLRLLRGHRGEVRVLRFVHGTGGAGLQLASLGDERDEGVVQSVVRLWDVENERELARWNELPKGLGLPNHTIPVSTRLTPGLAAWTDPRDRRARVALALNALPDLLVWNPADGTISRTPRANHQRGLLSAAAGDPGLLVGGQGGLFVWDVATQKSVASLPLKPDQLVRAVAWQPGQGRGPQRAAALVMTVGTSRTFDYRLYSLEFAAEPPSLKVVGDPAGRLVFKGDFRELSLAAGPSQVAVAGMPNEDIHIYPWTPGNAPAAARPTVLKTLARPAYSAAFIKSADEPSRWGIALHPEPIARKSADWLTHPRLRVYDVAHRRLTDAKGWTLNQPSLGTWRVRPSDDFETSGRFIISSGDQPSVSVDVNQWERAGWRHEVTASLFCPPTANRETPLLIVASYLNGETHLRAFRADTGEETLWFTGHIGFVRDLAASDDGRLLLSLSEDRTLCLWSLIGLDEVIGKGSPGDVVVSEDAATGRLIVREPGKGRRLQTHDELVGIEEGGATRPLATYRQFNQEFRRAQPGDRLTFEVRRGGARQRIHLDVVQAVRERKPLCTLFLTDVANGAGTWALWHPSGRFDSSGPPAERSLGWHFNTGDRQEPTRFVSIDQYRDNFYRQGLLQQLMESPELAPAEDDQPLPNLSLLIESLEEGAEQILDRDAAGQFRLQSSRARLIVVPDRDVPLKQLASMQWSWGEGTDGQQSGEFLWDDYGRWTAEIDAIPLNRRTVPVRVELRTTGAFPRVAETSGLVMTLPPPPKLSISHLPDRLTTDAAQIELGIQVEAVEPALLEVSVRRGDAIVSSKTRKVETAEELAFPISLEPGDNQILVTAVNFDAPKETKQSETATETYWIRRTETELAIVIDSVEAAGDPDRTNRLPPGTFAIATEAREVRISGTIRSSTPIDRVEYSYQNQKREERPNQNELPFQEVVTLDPGEHSWIVSAASGGRSVARFVAIDYRPALPSVSNVSFQTSLQPGRKMPERARLEPNSIYHGYHRPTLLITADVSPSGDEAADPGEYAAALVVNGETFAVEAGAIDRTDPKRHRLSQEAALSPGLNRVALVISNASAAEPYSVEQEIWYRRPPVVTDCSLADDQPVESPVSISGTVASIPELKRVVVEINGVKHQAETHPARDAEHLWRFEVRDVTLPQDVNQVAIRAANDESASIEPFERVVRVERPAPASEVAITVRNRNLGETTSARDIELDLAFDSPKEPIDRIELYDSAGRMILNANDDLKQKGHPRTFVWRPILELQEGPDNRFEIRAYDARGGAPARETLKIGYVPPAASLTIVSFDGKSPRRTTRGWELKPGERAKASPAKLRGRLDLPAPPDTDEPVSIKAIVNGIHRRTVRLSPSNGWSFELDLILNWEKENHIELQVAGPKLPLPVRTLYAGCEQPEVEQELFLIVIGPRAPQLKDHVFQALGVRQNAQGELESKAAGFKRVHCLAGCELTGSDALAHKALRSLERIKDEIRERRVKNPVVLIFYHGKDYVRAGGSLLLATHDNYDHFTGATTGLPANQLTDRNIEARARSIRAGNLLFVEVDERKPTEHVWEQPRDVAVFRRTIGERETFPLLAELNPVLPKVAKLKAVETSMIDMWKENLPTPDLASAVSDSIRIPASMEYLPFGGAPE